jgi:hypothetical protein
LGKTALDWDFKFKWWVDRILPRQLKAETCTDVGSKDERSQENVKGNSRTSNCAWRAGDTLLDNYFIKKIYI